MVAIWAALCKITNMSAERPFVELGGRLKLARETRKMSIGELADLIGVKRQAVSHWEKGGTEPGAIKLYQAADHLGVTLEWLVTGKGFGTGRAALLALHDEIQRKIAAIPS